ncbi:MAG: rod-binding protein [Desulfobacula sp.]|nr:rod-binding protein [Desulfobacula sp.]
MDIDLINQNLAKITLAKVKSQVTNPEAKTLKEEQLKEVCAGFEAIFLKTMLKSMRSSLAGNAIFPESNGMNIYKSMQDQYLSENLSKGKSSIGVREFLYQQLKNSL